MSMAWYSGLASMVMFSAVRAAVVLEGGLRRLPLSGSSVSLQPLGPRYRMCMLWVWMVEAAQVASHWN